MPARVASQQTAANAKGRGPGAAQPRSSNASRSDEQESGAEGAARKKFQKSPSATPMNVERSQLSKSEINHAAHKTNFTSRRRQSSIPNAKAAMGPRPLDIPAAKRSMSHSIAMQPTLDDDTPAPKSQDPQSEQFSLNNISRFSFASIEQQNPTPQDDAQEDLLDLGDLFTPINFDEFHNSITTDEPSLSHFPLPGRGLSTSFRPVEENKTLLPQPVNPPANTRKVSGTSSIGRRNSLARQQNTQATAVGWNSSKPESIAAGPATPVLRSRRQSRFPPNSYGNANTSTKAPRKSIGPGTFVEPDPSENKSPRRRPSVGVRKSSNEQKLMASLSIGMASLGIDADGSEETRVTGNAKSPALDSGHGSKHDNEKAFLTPSRAPDLSRGPGRTKSRSGTAGTTATPSSNAQNKRMSVMPPIATGLGARTISPTDARRMKRMSMAPPAPPLPASYLAHASPTPQPESSLTRSGSLLRSPGLRQGKSGTPSSSRTTPDPNRKSYSSGQSLSSSTSLGSARNSTGVPPLPASASSSRLPTPKAQLEPLSTSNGEEVPPVPAIPKAYESPQSEIEQPFFSTRSSGLPPGDTPLSASPHVTTFADAMRAIDIPRATSSSSPKYSYTPQRDAEQRQRPQPSAGKKNLAPLRLPPLNLVPLSTPTAAKIKALEEETFDSAKRPLTPPARQGSTKTPSTPLTASKATFFPRSHHEHDDAFDKHLRTSTSHHALRPPSSSSPDTPFSFDSGTPGPRIISPFTSSSLPKNSGELSRYMQPKLNGDLNRMSSQARPSGPRAPGFSVPPKYEEKETPSQPETSNSGLRRKLSRKRSETKVQESVETDVKALRYDNMPPPKLPASAIWSNLPATSASPAQRPSYLSTRRKASVSNINGDPPPAERQGSFSSTQSQSLEDRPSVESNRSFNSHSYQASRNHSVINGRASSATQTHLSEAGLDRDDLIAEEEMKRLGSRRKDFESAARELDALRRRACPRERISALHALQMTNLNLFERGEIVDFRDVYFTGTRGACKIVGDPNASATNFGYDDDRGDYNIVEGDHLAYRYEVVDLLGKGSFGQVVRCVDHKTGILVAVKIIRNKKRFHQQALVEVNILQKLREWDPTNRHSVVNFDQSFYFRDHLCISTDLLGMNLYEFIKAHDFKGFSLKLIRRFTKQLLACLVLLHNHKVIHCDLKPENVLLAHPMHSEIKVIDFGSSCFENEKVYTYIQSRFYRSPEVILGTSYGMPIDMWSLGCILAELYTGCPIFPGENEQEQLACIMEVFGPPEKHLIEKSSRKKIFFDSMGKPRLSISSKGKRRRPSSKDLRQALKCDDEAFLDFIARCLRWDPARRMTPHEASRHEFITGVRINNARKGPLATAANVPVKRVSSVMTPGAARPLPQPPATSFKHGMASRQPDSATSSPSKFSQQRRQSNINAAQPGLTAKRASHAAMAVSASSSTSTLTRVNNGQRGPSGKPDLAAAAAAAAASLAR